MKQLACVLIVFSSLAVISIAKAEDIFILDEFVVTGDKEKGIEESKIGSSLLKTHKVVDLAEILSDELITATMIRKGAYGNEVALRGFSQSNLRYLLDDTLIEGACGSRKDPPLSHMALLTVERIEVIEGPFDVTVPGALGGSINVVTIDPREGFHGVLFPKAGSYDYWSAGGYLTGGSELIQGLAGYNYSQSGQYEDGDGNKLSSFNPGYSEEGEKAEAFKKNDAWAKVQVVPGENQRGIVLYMYGEGKDILTPRVDMDMESEKTDFAKAEYIFTGLGDFSDQLTLSAYDNRVNHNPSNKFRTSRATTYKGNRVETSITGAKIENEQETAFATLIYGLDAYYHTWDGYMENKTTGEKINPYLFPDTNAIDAGLYLSAEKNIDKWLLSAGIRGDWFQTEADNLVNGELIYSQSLADTNRVTNAFPGGYFFAKYYPREHFHFFGGVGRSIRPPTLCERYLQASSGFYGNPDLKPTRNTEFDLGFQADFERIDFRIKGFYSRLDDYIYQQSGPPEKTWTNIDAHIYGGDIVAVVDIGYGFFIDAGAACQLGRKDSQPRNNTDKDLAQIPPLKTKLALDYDSPGLFGTLEWIHSEKASEVDIDAGEKKLPGWDVVNIRVGYVYKNFQFNAGIDNIFDKKYAVANSYEWDVVGGEGASPNIVNEPGRFFYGSVSYSF